MENREKQSVPESICSTCYRPKNAHAADCDYEKRIEDYKKSEGITPEFEAGVKSGEITFEKQMADLKKVWESLNESPPPLSEAKIQEGRERFASILGKFDESRRKIQSLLSSLGPDLVEKAITIDNKLYSLIIEISKLDQTVITEVGEFADFSASDPAIQSQLDYLDETVKNFIALVSYLEEKLTPYR